MKDFQVSKFSNFFLVGIDHTHASVDVRELFSLNETQAKQIIAEYKENGGDGLMILSTCNRTEIYGFGNCPRNLIQLFCKYTNTNQELFYKYQNIKQNREAIAHLFEVSSGLKSKIIGDFEIIGQVKKSFLLTKEEGASNPFLERLINTTIQVSKRIKNETSLSGGAASSAFAAVQHVKQYLAHKPGANVVLYGMGKIGKTTCENLVNQTGLSNITLINRTQDKATRLATRFGLKSTSFENLQETLNEADIIIVATGASKPTVSEEYFNTKKNRLVLDLSVPRNVHSKIYNNPLFTVIDIDHLSAITQENIDKRSNEIPAALKIVNEEISEFYTWLESRKVAPTLQALRQKMDYWKENELQQISKKFPELNTEQAEAFASQIINKITGQFARQLKNGDDINSNLRTIHHIFELEKTI